MKKMLFLLLLCAVAFAQKPDKKAGKQPKETSATPASAAGAKNTDKIELPVLKVSINGEYKGEVVIYLYDQALLHKENFLKHCREGYYNGTQFHRVIQGFMIQGGDPNSKDSDPANDGMGGPGYTVQAEIVPGLFHTRGAVAAARTGGPDNPERRSSGSQFYIVDGKKFSEAELGQYTAQYPNGLYQAFYDSDWSRRAENKWIKATNWDSLGAANPDSVRAISARLNEQLLAAYTAKYGSTPAIPDSVKALYVSQGGSPHLDGQYTVFGRVVKGMDIVDMVAAQPVLQPSRPTVPISITTEIRTLTRKEFEQQYPDFKLP